MISPQKLPVKSPAESPITFPHRSPKNLVATTFPLTVTFPEAGGSMVSNIARGTINVSANTVPTTSTSLLIVILPPLLASIESVIKSPHNNAAVTVSPTFTLLITFTLLFTFILLLTSTFAEKFAFPLVVVVESIKILFPLLFVIKSLLTLPHVSPNSVPATIRFPAISTLLPKILAPKTVKEPSIIAFPSIFTSLETFTFSVKVVLAHTVILPPFLPSILVV